MFRFLFRTIRFALRPRTWFAAGLGAAAVYFYDPDQGRARRAQATDQLKATARRAKQEAGREARYAAGKAEGTVAGMRPTTGPTADHALQATVESKVLRGDRYPKGEVNVEVNEGVVTLRGQVDTAQQRTELVSEVSGLAGVRTVVDHLHLPGEDAANKEPSLQGGGDGRSFG